MRFTRAIVGESYGCTWKVRDDDGDGIYIDAPGTDRGHFVAKVFYVDGVRPEAEVEANARLMCAAPALYAAVRHLVEGRTIDETQLRKLRALLSMVDDGPAPRS